jgi:hypothetical protein
MLRSTNHEASQFAVSSIDLIHKFYIRDPNIILSTHFYNTLSPCPSLSVKDKVSDTTTEKFTVLHNVIFIVLHGKLAHKR